jgi:hypothetical protein
MTTRKSADRRLRRQAGHSAGTGELRHPGVIPNVVRRSAPIGTIRCALVRGPIETIDATEVSW